MSVIREEILPQVSYKTSRSGGKGGQNVNKVSTKAELNFDFESSPAFNATEKQLLREKLRNRMTASGEIQIISDEKRSQLLNKENCLNKLMVILQIALRTEKPRKITRPKKSAIEKRLKDKQYQSLKKINRRTDL